MLLFYQLSNICGKIDSIGKVAGFSGDVRVLPEEPISFKINNLKRHHFDAHRTLVQVGPTWSKP
jgi:hypothetical protein